MLEALKTIEIDAVWLRIHPFGTTAAGPIALRGYIEACRDLHRVGVPLVAERSGTIGVALMAFGAVGGIESGITLGERFDARTLAAPRSPSAKPILFGVLPMLNSTWRICTSAFSGSAPLSSTFELSFWASASAAWVIYTWLNFPIRLSFVGETNVSVAGSLSWSVGVWIALHDTEPPRVSADEQSLACSAAAAP